MSAMLDHSEARLKVSPRKFREAPYPAMKNSLAAESQTAAPRVRQSTPSAVDVARLSGEADANAALMKLRELVVGPTQKINEARLEELMKIFDEREADLRSAMRDIQKRNSELEVALKQSSLDQLNAFKTEFQALTDSMNSESKKVVSGIREDIAASRKEALSLVQEAKSMADQKLEAERIRTAGLLDSETGKLRDELETAAIKLETTVIASQREAHLQMSRALKEASEVLARLATAS